jgi:hypothetical protein
MQELENKIYSNEKCIGKYIQNILFLKYLVLLCLLWFPNMFDHEKYNPSYAYSFLAFINKAFKQRFIII